MNLPDYFLADLPADAPLSRAMMAEACHTLKRNRDRYLEDRSTESLIDLLSGLAENWLDPDYPLRQLALQLGPEETGFSPATLSAGLDALFGLWTVDHLSALLQQELGHAHRLDRFAAAPWEKEARRSARATGPRLLFHIAAGNVPNPILMSIALGLLSRAGQFVKCATGAALLPRLFAHSLYQAEPKLGACLEVAAWKGGRLDLEQALYDEADLVTATGSDATLAEIRGHLSAQTRFLGYGHRVSFGYLAHESLSRHGAKKMAALAAADVAAWDQLGCLSPHVFYVEQKGAIQPELFAEMLAAEMAKREIIAPRGTLTTADAASISSRRALYEVRAAASPGTCLWKSEGSTAWTVVYEAEPGFQFSCLNRFIHVNAVANLTEALNAAEPVRGRVSTVGLAAPDGSAEVIATELARWGVTRICAIGQMQNPPLTWRHDGRPGLGDLVTWTDWEQ